ncbi:MAG: hypothetical protein QF535_22515 [Anaerolineales bacterium]|jgi:hypothetical protein|nr:hypothetical protein [Anaerolineales bacterium]|tara:strand:+ start:5474 stop:5800 length:327 start_codon:yes stop_codon:yes gene_type:complete
METYILICLDEVKYFVHKADAKLQVTQQTENSQVTQILGTFRAPDYGKYWLGLDEFLAKTGQVPVFDWHNYATTTSTILELSKGLGVDQEVVAEILKDQGIMENTVYI